MRHRRLKGRWLLSGIVVLAVGWLAACSAEGSKPSYIGAGRCKPCHLKKEYKAWGETRHAKAFSRLKDNEAKDPKCVKCHVTGYGKGGYVIGGKNNPDLANVQCEACHGPGSEYKFITKDLAKEMAVGLFSPMSRVAWSATTRRARFTRSSTSRRRRLNHRTSSPNSRCVAWAPPEAPERAPHVSFHFPSAPYVPLDFPFHS